MGLRNRLRILRIQSGLEQPISDNNRYSTTITKDVIMTKCADITNITEIKTCKQIMALLNVPKIPQHIVKDKLKEGMYKVIKRLEDAGETSEAIFKFYWDIPEFQTLWKRLNYTEDDWREMLK
jgi:hypothetical protein